MAPIKAFFIALFVFFERTSKNEIKPSLCECIDGTRRVKSSGDAADKWINASERRRVVINWAAYKSRGTPAVCNNSRKVR